MHSIAHLPTALHQYVDDIGVASYNVGYTTTNEYYS